MKRFLLLGGLVVGGLVPNHSWAQPSVNSSLNGTEVIQGALGAGGTGFLIEVEQLRHARTTIPYTISGPITVSFGREVTSLLFINQITGAVVINPPLNAWDGQIFEFMNGSTLAFTATVSLVALAGQTVVNGAVPTMAANSTAVWRYIEANKTWYRVQ